MLDALLVPMIDEGEYYFLTVGHLVPKLALMDIYYQLSPYRGLIDTPLDALTTEVFHSQADIKDVIKKIVDEFIR